MLIPGANLLNLAHRLISWQKVKYFVTTGRTLNAAKQWVATYDAGKDISCSIQAINRSTYVAMGLDFNVLAVNIFAPLNLIDLQRDSSGDQFEYNGDRYKMANGQNWFEQDGWATCMAVRIGPVVAAP
jgi:hypothetical protein